MRLGTHDERSFKNVSFALLTEQLNAMEGSMEEALAVFFPPILTWVLHALCHMQALLPSWERSLESAVIVAPSLTVQCLLFRG